MAQPQTLTLKSPGFRATPALAAAHLRYTNKHGQQGNNGKILELVRRKLDTDKLEYDNTRTQPHLSILFPLSNRLPHNLQLGTNSPLVATRARPNCTQLCQLALRLSVFSSLALSTASLCATNEGFE
jgi:hypothetical protein